jgi:NAD(P)H-dependent flavin oxidoreductase YrpB (nitropropane dioxygenase family)
MLTTRFTKMVGCSVPIQQAGMGPVSPPQLAAAVSQAGGLGTVAARQGGGMVDPCRLSDLLAEVRASTSQPFGINFLPSRHYTRPLLTACVAEAAKAARVVEFFYADPDPELVQVVHAGGALAAWAIGSREEALLAVDAGCDFIIAQGIEAGGHVRGTIGLLPLLGEVLDAVPVPVLAAGGIGTGRAMAAALAAGADGVRVGTRFAAAEEAGAHPRYVEALVGARAKDTVYTDAFSVGWPDAPVRVLRSSLAAAEAFPEEIVGEAINRDGTVTSVLRLMGSVPDRLTSGHIDAMCWPAGESVSGLKRVQCAGEIVRELAAESEDLLRRW